MTSKLPAFLMRATFRTALGELLDWMEGVVRLQKTQQNLVDLLSRPPRRALLVVRVLISHRALISLVFSISGEREA